MSSLEALHDQIMDQHPTDQQRDAIFAEELEFLLRAAPGSGKTWTSCRRFIWRGANWPHRAGGLALLSFTNVAIREFQQATIKIGRRDLLSDPNYVGTFDSFVERYILTPFGHLIMGTAQRPKLFINPRPGDRNNKNIMAWVKMKGGLKPVPAWEIVPYPDKGRAAFRTSDHYGSKKLQFSGRNPVSEFMSLGFYTHEHRVFWACYLLSKRPHIADILARRFPEIVVDEAQDTNIWLLKLLEMLREKGSKITIVGDPDQCIYEFSMADATSLLTLKEQWEIPEKPLSKSFRCNDNIAVAARSIVGNEAFVGCGDGSNCHCQPIVIREPDDSFAHSVTEFQRLLALAEIPEASSAIICRAHRQLEAIRGETNYADLKGITKKLAQASFFRDTRKDYKRAFQIVDNAIHEIIDDSDFWKEIDEFPESEKAQRYKMVLWRFVKSDSELPSVNLNGTEWIARARENLGKLIKEIGIATIPNLNRRINKKGLGDDQMTLPLFEAHSLFPPIRQETIHQVKGESIDGVLVLGSTSFWNSVVKDIVAEKNSEERRLAYVAMTRARHLLVVALPASHYDRNVQTWTSWGFNVV